MSNPCPKVMALVKALWDLLPVAEQARQIAHGIAGSRYLDDAARNAAYEEEKRLGDLMYRARCAADGATEDCFYIVVPGQHAAKVLAELAPCGLAASGSPVAEPAPAEPSPEGKEGAEA